ncbi:MAG: DUF4139 domain-containing protein [Paludibacteraceae bacterium]|nr:DUF4139 domain-containing protein [Paludibacteraceae bacterium]
MNTRLFIASICIAALCSLNSQAAPYTAKIEHVTVFTSGAELAQKVSLPLQTGDNTVVIEGLSPYINEKSLQIALGGGVIVQQYAFSTDYLSADKRRMNTAALEDSLKMAQDALADAERRISTISQMQALLQTGVNSTLTANTGVTTALIDKNLQYYRTNALNLAKRLDATKAEKTALDKRIKALQQQIRENGGLKAGKSGIVTLELNSPKKQTITAALKYFTPRASWYATYDLNILSLQAPIDLLMKAHVSQTTGIDWEKAPLTLSTGSPSRTNEAPTLSTWWLQEQVVRVRGAYAAKNMVMAAAVMDEAAVEEDAVVASLGNYVTTTEEALSVEYAISLPYTIAGNGKEQMIALMEKQITDVTYSYYAAPRLDRSAYLVAYINNWQALSLPDGMANITYNGTYYGESRLATNNDEARVRLTLGDDPQVKIKRELTAQNSKTSGNTKQVSYTYTTTVRNDKKEAVKLTVTDQYPVSSAKEIQVSVGDKITPPTTENKQTGILTYDLQLAPGESKTIVLSYTVKYPKDWRINL